MIEPGLMAGQPGFDLAQARSAGELAEQQRQKLAFAVKPAHTMVGLVLSHQMLERGPGNVLGQGVKYAIFVPHGIDLRFVSQTRSNV